MKFRSTALIHDYRHVVGVIDVSAGHAVAAVGGHRHAYRPIAEPIDGDLTRWTRHLRDAGVAGLYVADLDAIRFGVANDLEPVLAERCDRPVWIDSGGKSIKTSPNVIRIAAAECVPSPPEASPPTPSDQSTAISLDYRGEVFLGTDQAAWRRHAIKTGCDVFVIDLLAVGSGSVRVLDRCRSLRRDGFAGRLIAGGGVRDDADVRRLRDAGCDLVMVGTALHPRRTDSDQV